MTETLAWVIGILAGIAVVSVLSVVVMGLLLASRKAPRRGGEGPSQSQDD